jgi:WD40 repeat protein
LRHPGATILNFSADGKTVISAGEDEAIRVWEVATGRLLRKRPGPRLPQSGPRYGSAFSLSGSLLAFGHFTRDTRGIIVWDVALGKELHTLPWEGRPTRSLAFSPDGRTLAASRDPGDLLLLDAESGKERLPPIQFGRYIRQIAFSPDGKLVAAASADQPRGGLIRLWEVATGKESRQFVTKDEAIAFSADSRVLATAGRGEKVTLWDMDTGKERTSFSLPPPDWLYRRYNCLVFSPNGNVLAAGGDGRPLVLWDTVKGRELHRLPVGWATEAVFAPDGKTLATSAHGAIRLWDPKTGKELHASEGHTGVVNALAVSPDGRTLATGSWEDFTVRLWDTTTQRQRHVLRGHTAYIRAVSFAPSGRTLASAGGDGTVRLWDVNDGKELHVFSGGERKPGELPQTQSLVFSEDGKTLAAFITRIKAGPPEESYLWVWDIATGRTRVPGRKYLIPDFDSPRLLRFTPNGLSILMQKQGEVVRHNIETGKEQRVASGEWRDGSPAALSTDGRTFAVGAATSSRREDTVVVVQLAEDRPPLKLPTGDVGLVALSPDARYLAAAGPNDLRLRELASGLEVLRRLRHEPLQGVFSSAFVSAMAYTADGRQLATGFSDSTVLFWDLTPGQRPTDRSAEDLWADLAGTDAPRAYAAVWQLSQRTGDATVAFLRERLHPAKGPDPAQVGKLLRELGSEKFNERQAASKALAELGEDVRPALRRALADNPPLEVRQRLDALLAGMAALRPGDGLRGVRAVEVLERIGTPAARRCLEGLAGGEPETRLTREARSTLQRITGPPRQVP